MSRDKDVLTTGEVARICNVAPRTVSKWFDSGQLRGYRIPGSKDRRIPLNALIKFMKSHGIPMDGLVSGETRVLTTAAVLEVSRGNFGTALALGFILLAMIVAVAVILTGVQQRARRR